MADSKIKSISSNRSSLMILFLLIAVLVSLQSYIISLPSIIGDTVYSTNFNNYLIFKYSFFHLINGQDLYSLYPMDHGDLYKYTPTFAVFFGIFAYFPDWLGLILWNALNALLLIFAVYAIPKMDNLKKALILLILLIDLITSMQNMQSNGLVAGLLVFTFAMLEREKFVWACLFIVLSIYVKLFGLVGFTLFLFYPKKWKLALYTMMWSLVLFLIPLIFVSISEYIHLYESFWNMLSHDHSTSYGYSVMGLVSTWFSVNVNKLAFLVIGVLLFLVPLIRIKEYSNFNFRLLLLSSILIWVVIFNHKAESPTFVIAMTGVGIWFMNMDKSKLNIGLLISAILLTSLSTSDLFPRTLRLDFFQPYVIKALPCVLIWGKIIYDMMTIKGSKELVQINKKSTTKMN